MMKSVIVGIITFNGAHRVGNLLTSIKKWSDYPEGYKVNIFIVDDGSHELRKNEMMWISQHFQVPVLFHRENEGISKSWNDICRYTSSDFVVLLNDDVLVSQYWLTCMIYFLENNPHCGAAGWNFYYIIDEDIPIILKADMPIAIHRDPFKKQLLLGTIQQKEEPEQAMAAVGAFFGFRRRNYEMVGGFDERFISFYEEIDFGTMLARKGYPSYMLPYPLLYHQWGKTFAENADVLMPGKLMDSSRKAYIKKWGGDIGYTESRFMSVDVIKKKEATWLDKNLEPQKAIV